MIKSLWFFTVLIFSLFISCSNEISPLSNSDGEYYFFTVEEGTLLSSGTDVQVSFSESGIQSDRIVIRLKNEDLDEIAVVEVQPDDLKGDGLPVSLPDDLAEGVYLLSFEAWESDAVLSESEVYFYVVAGNYSVTGIETYPPSVQAGGDINARAYLSYPEGRDPWLRWSLDDQVLKEGFLSDIGVTNHFSVPDEEGVFSLKGELFPVKPQAVHHSTAVSHTDLFVTTENGDSWSLPGDKVYTFYVSFKSGTKDAMSPSVSPKIIGKPQALGKEYSFSSKDGVLYSYNPLPLGADGVVQDFSLSMDFDYRELPSSGTWRMITIGKESSAFIVYYNGSEDAFYAGFSGNGGDFAVFSGDLLSKRGQVSLDITYTESNGAGKITWASQDNILNETSVSAAALSNNGEMLIGAAWSAAGLPLQWLGVGISKSREHKQSTAPQASPSDAVPQIVYSRTSSFLDKIAVDRSSLNPGFYTLEIYLDRDVLSGSWQFVLSDENGTAYYTFDSFFMEDSVSNNEKMKYPEIMSVSFVNNEDGLFLSHSSAVKGPFPYQESLNFQIVPYNNASADLGAIKEIRFYQD